MNRWVKVALALSLALNLVLISAAGWYVARVGARPVAEAAGVLEPRRPAFEFYAAEEFEGLPGADVLMIGDSQIERGRWSELLGVPVANRGRSGARIAEVTASLDESWTGAPSTVIVWAGSNDVMAGMRASMRADMDALLDAVVERAPGVKVVVLSVPMMYGLEVTEANAMLESSADAHGAEWVDVTKALDGKLAHDGAHITAEGYVEVAELLKSP